MSSRLTQASRGLDTGQARGPGRRLRLLITELAARGVARPKVRTESWLAGPQHRGWAFGPLWLVAVLSLVCAGVFLDLVVLATLLAS